MKYLVLFLLAPLAAFAQTKPTAMGNFVYIDQVGSNNSISIDQQDIGNKQALVINNGDVNEFTILQKGTGNHVAAIGPNNTSANSNNNNNILSITQEGSGNHTASILFQNTTTNNNNTASITQKGNIGADKQFNLQISGSNANATVVQDNLTTPDNASMSIQCLTPPCSGYSYIKH